MNPIRQKAFTARLLRGVLVMASLWVVMFFLNSSGRAVAQDEPWLDQLKADIQRELTAGAENREHNLWIAGERTKAEKACNDRTEPDVKTAIDMIEGCGECGGAQKRANVQKIRQLQAQKCKSEGLDAENRFVPQLKAEFLHNLSDKKLNSARWRGLPLNAPITSREGQRSSYQYSLLINQFHVDDAPRYAAGNRDTYCNVFVLDVTHNMNADLRGVLENPLNQTSVNDIADGLKRNGAANGWYRVDWHVAQQRADEGRPTLALWENQEQGRHGHMAIVRPGTVGDTRGVVIAQSGSFTVNASHLKDEFVDRSGNALTPVEYWAHD